MASEDPIEECHEEKMPYECFECGGDIRSLPDGMGTCDYCEKEKAQGKVKTLTDKLNMAEAREKGLRDKGENLCWALGSLMIELHTKGIKTDTLKEMECDADIVAHRKRWYGIEAQNKVLREGLEEIALKQVAFADFPTSLLELKTFPFRTFMLSADPSSIYRIIFLTLFSEKLYFCFAVRKPPL